MEAMLDTVVNSEWESTIATVTERSTDEMVVELVRGLVDIVCSEKLDEVNKAKKMMFTKDVGTAALLSIFGLSVGMGEQSGDTLRELLVRAAKRLGVGEEVGLQAFRTAKEPLSWEEMEGYQKSMTELFFLSCANPKEDSMEAMLWLLSAVMTDDKTWVPYDARVRSGLRRLAVCLKVPWKVVAGFEVAILRERFRETDADKVRKTVEESEMSARANWKKRVAVTTAATIGAGLLATTGLIALPAIGAALTTVAGATGMTFVGTAATAAGSASGMILTGSTLGAAGASLAGSKMQRRVDGVHQFEFHKVEEGDLDNCAALTIVISGWVTESSDFSAPWVGLPDMIHEEVNYLVWEEKELTDLGKMLANFLYDQALETGLEMVVKRTVLRGLLQAAAWPATIVAAASLIDNAWSVAMSRAASAGRLLAKILLRNTQGYRPVSLIGYSLGARVIFIALQEISKQNRLDIVENVVFLGAPVSSDEEEWRSVRRVVAGRIVNVYSEYDWILYFLYRSSSLNYNVAGLNPVQVPDVENIDMADDLNQTPNYRDNLQDILRELNLYSDNS